MARVNGADRVTARLRMNPYRSSRREDVQRDRPYGDEATFAGGALSLPSGPA
jgi:hypothetical protein